MKDTPYKQCLLHKRDGDGVLVDHSWIPAKFAVVGKVLKLKLGGVWVDGWVVVEVWPLVRTEEYLPDPHREIKSHRRNTGDSLPRVV